MITVLGWVVICVIVADFISGLIHWWEDTYCIEKWLEFICEPNIQHHLDPKLMVRAGSFISRNWLQWLMGFLVWGCCYSFGFGYWQVALTILIASFGNQIHYWTHSKDPPAFVRFLTDAGVMQSKRHHNAHHKPPYMKNYCILTNFTDSVLERIGFWRRLEGLIERFFGIPPRTRRPDQE